MAVVVALAFEKLSQGARGGLRVAPGAGSGARLVSRGLKVDGQHRAEYKAMFRIKAGLQRVAGAQRRAPTHTGISYTSARAETAICQRHEVIQAFCAQTPFPFSLERGKSYLRTPYNNIDYWKPTENTMASVSSSLAVLGVAIAVIYVALQFHLRATQDPREPSIIETKLPYITPTIGLSKHSYFAYLRYSRLPVLRHAKLLIMDRKHYANLPIFTLRLPGQRIYVINDAQLISAVQKQHKILTFQSVEDSMSHRMFNLSAVGKGLQEQDAAAWRSAPAHIPSPAHVQFNPLAPGKDLDHMNKVMLRALEDSMEEWVPSGSQSRKTPLFEWIKEALIVPTTNGVYVLTQTRTFFNGIPTMIKGGRWLVKDSVAAIDSLGLAWQSHFQQNHHEKYSGLIQKMYKYYTEREYPPKDISQFIVGTSVAVLGNTLPAAFWFITRLCANPAVFQACREEILAQVAHSRDDDGRRVQTLDVTALKTSCPLLNSAFKEVLRLDAIGTGVRGVEEDHMLGGQYLLRKGALIFMPLVSQHYDYERWGGDAEEYCYDRFTDKTRPRVSNVSFRSFGGGTTLCPGRHFVTTELLAFAAMVLLRFEIVPAAGEWVVPSSLNAEMTTNMPAPDFDIDVEIRRRSDDEGIKWNWTLSESEHVVMLGDQDEHGNEKI
ncbi:hypothetical protein N0V95_004762 [Ascochyta clinopodiicola]|nr:hypothetical protein N0V95_004762 [Ascochyta clinopodiicola]